MGIDDDEANKLWLNMSIPYPTDMRLDPKAPIPQAWALFQTLRLSPRVNEYEAFRQAVVGAIAHWERERIGDAQVQQTQQHGTR